MTTSYIMHFVVLINQSYNDFLQLFQEKKYLIISAADSPKQDLSQYISQTNDFIHAARFRGGHVLIHW